MAPAAFSYREPGSGDAPVVERVTPLISSTAGGATIRIKGKGLAGATVRMAGVLCGTTREQLGYYRDRHLCDWPGVHCGDLHANDTHIACITNPARGSAGAKAGKVEVRVPGAGIARVLPGAGDACIPRGLGVIEP